MIKFELIVDNKGSWYSDPHKLLEQVRRLHEINRNFGIGIDIEQGYFHIFSSVDKREDFDLVGIHLGAILNDNDYQKFQELRTGLGWSEILTIETDFKLLVYDEDCEDWDIYEIHEMLGYAIELGVRVSDIPICKALTKDGCVYRVSIEFDKVDEDFTYHQFTVYDKDGLPIRKFKVLTIRGESDD